MSKLGLGVKSGAIGAQSISEIVNYQMLIVYLGLMIPLGGIIIMGRWHVLEKSRTINCIK